MTITPLPNFFQRVKEFNQMYHIPTPPAPLHDRAATLARLDQFMPIIEDEISEGRLLQDKGPTLSQVDLLTELADWYGDIIVYGASEMARHGLPADAILSIIMDSNASKLQADGTALMIDGKLQKGPNYWKPEPKIKALIESLLYAQNWGQK